MIGLFDASIVSSRSDYIALRDHPRNAPLRQIADELWGRFFPYADPLFPHEFALHLHHRFWEMYLAVSLLENGLLLQPKRSSKGPDIHLKLALGDVWVEAVAPDEGQGPDAVPPLRDNASFGPVPEDKIILH